MIIYIKEGCPFCEKTLNFIETNNIEVERKEISDESNLKELIELGGKQQVPFLVDGDTRLYESDDIIKYLSDKIS